MENIQVKSDHESDDVPNREKTRGNLHETLDPLLHPRKPQKQPGRSKCAKNYQWSPAADAILIEVATQWEPSKAKAAIYRRLAVFHGAAARTRPDAYRKAVEHRLAKLGLSIGSSRRSAEERVVRSWTEAQVKALIGSLGEDVSFATMAKRTGHSVKAVRAKMARLEYTAADIPGFTADDLATLLLVTPRQIRRWKEKRWLETKNHRITEGSVRRFLSDHPDRIDFDKLSYEARVYLADLGYECKSMRDFRKSATEILSSLGRDRTSRKTGSGPAKSKSRTNKCRSEIIAASKK